MKPHFGHSSLSSKTAVQYEFHTYFTSFHCTGRYWQIDLALNVWLHSSDEGLTLETSAFQIFHGGNFTFDKTKFLLFTAQLVEHRTGVAEVTGSNLVEVLIFFRLLPSNCLNWKNYAMIILHFRLQPQYNMNFICISL